METYNGGFYFNKSFESYEAIKCFKTYLKQRSSARGGVFAQEINHVCAHL